MQPDTHLQSRGKAVRHRCIREQGLGGKLDRLIALLAEHRAACDEVVRLDHEAPDNAISSLILRQKAKEARKCIRAIDATLDNPMISRGAFDDLGTWGSNGNGPRVAELLRSARWHAEQIKPGGGALKQEAA